MKIDSKKLQTALNYLKPIASHRSTLPILNCVRLEAKNNTLVIDASDLDQQQSEHIECSGNLPQLCIGFMPFLIATAGSGEIEITTNKDNSELTVKSASGTVTLKTNPDDFPRLMKCEKAVKTGVATSDLSSAIKAVEWAAPTNDARYNLYGVFIEGHPKMLRTVATNRRDMCISETASICATFTAYVPATLTAGFCAALEREGAALSVSEANMLVDYDGGEFCCKQPDCKFPNYTQILDKKPVLLGSVKREPLLDVIAQCNFFSDPTRTPSVNFEFSKMGISLSFSGSNSNLNKRVDGEFVDHTARMNVQSFFTCLRNIKSDDVKIFKESEDRQPLLILTAGDLTVYTCAMMYK